jgi:hypothetical protein
MCTHLYILRHKWQNAAPNHNTHYFPVFCLVYIALQPALFFWQLLDQSKLSLFAGAVLNQEIYKHVHACIFRSLTVSDQFRLDLYKHIQACTNHMSSHCGGISFILPT